MTTNSSPLFGINLPWFDGAYGHDLAPNPRLAEWPVRFDTMRAYRPLIEARELGFKAVRVWLCENAEGIVLDANGLPEKPHADLLERIRIIQECAKLAGLRVYWTLLDGNAWGREGDAITHAILGGGEATARFADGVAAEIVKVLDPDVTFAVEVVNEPEALTADCVKPELKGEAISWDAMGKAIRRIGDAMRAVRSDTIVTAGTLHMYLPQFLKSEPGVGAIDLHAYHLNGGLPSREDLAKYTGDARLLDRSIPLIAGEAGIPDDAPESAMPALTHFLYNAQQYGYDAAFLWRLEQTLIDTSDKKARGVRQLARDVTTAMKDVASR